MIIERGEQIAYKRWRWLDTGAIISERNERWAVRTHEWYNIAALLLLISSAYVAPWMIIAISSWYIVDKIKRKEFNLSKSSLIGPYALMLLSVVISDVSSPDALEIAATLLIFIPYIIYGIYVEETFTKPFALLILSILVWTSVPITVFGVIQKILNDSGIIFKLAAGRVVSTFYNANLYAFYLVFIILLSLGLYYCMNGYKKLQYGLVMVMILAFVNLYLTASRMAMISLMIGGIFFYVLSGRYHMAHVLFMAAIILALTAMAYPQIIPRYMVLDSNLHLRENIWSIAIWGIRYRPIIGRGLLSYWSFASFFGINELHAHNIILNVWFEWGILGVVSIIWYGVVIFKRGLTALKASPYRTIIAGILSSVIAAFIQSMTDNPAVNIQTGIVLILSVSILMVLTRRESSEIFTCSTK